MLLEEIIEELEKNENKDMFVWIKMMDGIYLYNTVSQDEVKIGDFYFSAFRKIKKELRRLNVLDLRNKVYFNIGNGAYSADIFRVDGNQDIIIKRGFG